MNPEPNHDLRAEIEMPAFNDAGANVDLVGIGVGSTAWRVSTFNSHRVRNFPNRGLPVLWKWIHS